MKTLTQWLLLITLLLAPLAMQPAAAANPSSNHHATMASGEGHCQPASPTKSHLTADCSMACASALPAVDSLPMETPASPEAIAVTVPSAFLAGLTPESATPPPRHG